jgi:hypothetical protein
LLLEARAELAHAVTASSTTVAAAAISSSTAAIATATAAAARVSVGAAAVANRGSETVRGALRYCSKYVAARLICKGR